MTDFGLTAICIGAVWSIAMIAISVSDIADHLTGKKL